jgi:hypothetical protein
MHDHAGVAVDEDPRVAWRVRTTTTVGLFRCLSISLASAVFFLLVTRWNMHIFSFDKSGKGLVYGYPHRPVNFENGTTSIQLMQLRTKRRERYGDAVYHR